MAFRRLSMVCCDCCCPGDEECCKGPGPNGICCDPARCCGTEESPECCEEGEYCCDDACQATPCDEEECETDEDCDYCNEGFSLVGGAYNISDELRCCADGAIGWIDDAGDPRSGNCVSDIDPGNVDNNFNIVAGDSTQPGYCCDGVCSEEECPEPLAVKLTLGPGSILKAMLAKMGIKATAKCKCAKMARQMDAWGQESLNHLDEIADVMEETAKKRGLPFSRTAAKLMIRIACWRARRGNKK
jgi:hypothetical protein